ncbi:MAG: hypothetical protein H7Y07_14775 [Pyrinomonadaceae bacterium]|jgi:hypothetical protein|nr:hypothetical protein [Sphingobacteriaceae bacterium]MBC7915375.1 hypothetical protein [Sphingobacteriaceae bacterium]
MEKQYFVKYRFVDARTGDLIRYMNINEKLTDHNDRLKKMAVQIYNEIKIPVTSITYEQVSPAR